MKRKIIVFLTLTIFLLLSVFLIRSYSLYKIKQKTLEVLDIPSDEDAPAVIRPRKDLIKKEETDWSITIVNSTGEYPDDFPNDVPKPPNSKIFMFHSSTIKPPIVNYIKQTEVTFSIKDRSVRELANLYIEAFENPETKWILYGEPKVNSEEAKIEAYFNVPEEDKTNGVKIEISEVGGKSALIMLEITYYEEIYKQ